jgi:catechol 2,3-dioxygenase-like lactoylglutathione lyase family enzyme
MNEIVALRLQFFTIHTRNLDTARQFYVEVLGFPIVEERRGEFFQVSIAGVPVCVDLDTSFTGAPNQIGITVSNLESTIAALRERRLVISEGRSTKAGWAAVKDPDGHELIFIAGAQEQASGVRSPLQ